MPSPFVIIVIIAQQIDSNLIHPRVVGLWAVDSGDLGAVRHHGGRRTVRRRLGMIVGVPVMSIIYTVMREKTASGTPNQPASTGKKARCIQQSVQTLYSRAAEKRKTAKTTTAILRMSGFGERRKISGK